MEALAGEGKKIFMAATLAFNPCKPVMQNATAKILIDNLRNYWP